MSDSPINEAEFVRGVNAVTIEDLRVARGLSRRPQLAETGEGAEWPGWREAKAFELKIHQRGEAGICAGPLFTF